MRRKQKKSKENKSSVPFLFIAFFFFTNFLIFLLSTCLVASAGPPSEVPRGINDLATPPEPTHPLM